MVWRGAGVQKSTTPWCSKLNSVKTGVPGYSSGTLPARNTRNQSSFTSQPRIAPGHGGRMLHEFVTTHRDAIITRAREKLTARPWPIASTDEVEYGVPLFLSQLSETLKWELTATPFSPKAIGDSAARHGRELLNLGYSVAQVVHDYGDICQPITEVSLDEGVQITTDEFHTLNRCLDTAIAEAVTEHARITAQSRSSEDVERLGRLTHELRDTLNTALLAFHTLKRGTVAINGSTGAVLGRSL